MSGSNPISMDEILKIAASPAGQKLIQALRQNNNQQIQQALQKASEGDFYSAKRVLSALTQEPDVKEFLKQLGGDGSANGR